MARLEDLKPCPFGCAERRLVFYSTDRRVQCSVCKGYGPDSAGYLSGDAGRNSAIRKQLAALLWDARTPQQMAAVVAQAASNSKGLLNSAAPPPAAKPAGQWQPCTQGHGTFVAGVEYRAQLLPSSSPTADLFAQATDDEGDTHTVPARCFAGLLGAVAA